MIFRSLMVKFFMPSAKSSRNIYFPRQSLAITKRKLAPISKNKAIISQSRTFAESKGTKGPKKEEEVQKIKMPGFVHPESHNEEGYFTQQARKQIEELKKKLEKPAIDNKERKE